MKRCSLWFVLLLLALAAVPAFAQQPPPAFDLALADLSARVGRPLTQADLATFSWAQDVYPDTGFGCPTPPAEVAAGPVSAYVVTITLDGITYDYRVAADGSTLFLCSETGTGTTPTGPTLEPGTPAAVPECPTGFVGYLTPRLTPASQATVAGDAPNRLRSAPTTSAGQIGLLEPGTALTVVAGPACADGFVWWQVNDGNQTGWTAEGQLPDAYWLEPAGDVAVELTPEVSAIPQLATVSADAISLWTLAVDELVAVGDIALPPLSDNGWALQVAFSPAGNQLAVRTTDFVNNETVNSLYLADAVPGATPQLIADDLFYGMPVSFAAGGELLYAVEDPDREVTGSTAGSPQGGAAVAGQVVVQPIEGARTALTDFDFGVGCGGGSPYPAVGAFDLETGYGGRPLTLAQTNEGLLISTNCTGSGLALIDLALSGDERTTVLGEHLSRAVLSLDGTQIAALEDDPTRTGPDTLTVIDLATGEAQALVTTNAPQQVAWTSDSRLLYSSYTETGETVPGTTEAAFTSMGFTEGIAARDVMITTLDPETGDETVIYTGPGFQIGRLLPLPDGDLLFTVIPQGEAWVEASNAGTLTDTTAIQLFAQFFRPALLLLSPDTANVAMVGEGFLTTLNSTALAEG